MLWLTTDAEAQVRAQQRAFDMATAQIHATRQAGASLYLANVDPKDFEPVLEFAPELIEHWLDGYCELTEIFQRRVLLAEGVFLGLCEALLAHDPSRGTKLWRALRCTMTTRFVGQGDVEELVHMAFRVPDSSDVMILRSELLDLKHCHTDQTLLDVALAASCNGRGDWLTNIIRADRGSAIAWQRKRGEILSGEPFAKPPR
ncbi:MAG: hypothetical protein OXQ31_09445 [Spirochaetaceae bacterium]|nr:hypothetical protein [Spirochaetaceae bacterium]